MLNMKNTYTHRYQLERLLLSIWKKKFICLDGRSSQFGNYLAFRTAEVFCMANGTRSDSAFREAFHYLHTCHTLVTDHLSLLVYVSKVVLYRCQDICCFFHFHYTQIDQQDTKTFNFLLVFST